MESTTKRDLASTSSGQTTQSKRPCLPPPIKETSDGLETDLLRKSFLTEEDIARVVREQLEPFIYDLAKQVREQSELLKSQLPDLFTSCILNTLKVEVVPQICPLLEDTCRIVVREELEHLSSQTAQLVRSSGKCRKKDEVRNLQLQFKTKLPTLFFTGEKLKGEGSIPIEFQLVDASTTNIVKLGPEYSVKVQVVALDGGFKTENDCNWTREEFEDCVRTERRGKRPLLIGDLEVIFNGGTGVLGDVEFTDNSKWTKSGKFRIGLQALPGYCENIREAITEAFTVNENRGKVQNKHRPPAPGDEVWRLKKIGKDGPFHKKLSEASIYTVEEFLQQFNDDPDRLRKILGMAGNKWEDLVNHAKTCPPNGKSYMFQDMESDRGVMVTDVGQLSSLTADWEYCAADTFSLEQEELGDVIVEKAFRNWKDVRPIINPSSRSDYTVSENVVPSEPPSASIPSFQSCSAPPVPEGNPVMGGFGSPLSEWEMQDLIAAPPSPSPPDVDMFLQTPP